MIKHYQLSGSYFINHIMSIPFLNNQYSIENKVVFRGTKIKWTPTSRSLLALALKGHTQMIHGTGIFTLHENHENHLDV